MSWQIYALDVAFIVIVVIAIYRGYRRGLVNQIVWLVSFVAAYLVAAQFGGIVAGWIERAVDSERVTLTAAYVLLFLATIVVMRLVAKGITKVLNMSFVGVANAVLGALLNGLIAVTAVAVLVNVSILVLPGMEKRLGNTIVLKHIMALNQWTMDTSMYERITKAAERLELDEIGK